jgi:ATP-dependent DNA ligase
MPRRCWTNWQHKLAYEDGKPSFNLLQGFGSPQAIVLYAFDLLMLDGKDVRLWRLDERREQLREIIAKLPDRIR